MIQILWYVMPCRLTNNFETSLTVCQSTRCNIPEEPSLQKHHFENLKPPTRVTGFLLGSLTLEDGTDRLSRNVGKKLPLLTA